MKWIRNLQEGRHALGRKVFHGSMGELYQRYREGMEDQLGALGVVLNCIVLWNTVYINAALQQLRAAGSPPETTGITGQKAPRDAQFAQ